MVLELLARETPLVIGWGAVIVLAALFRSRTFAAASGVFLGVALLIWVGISRHLPEAILIPFRVLSWITVIHYAMLIRPRLRRWWYRALVSLPGLWFLGGTLLAFPWAIVGAFGIPIHGWWVPYLLVGLGFLGSLRNPIEDIEIGLDGDDIGDLRRCEPARVDGIEPLTLAQITDPHLGPFMSPGRLRAICTRIAERNPDLVAITGDIMTMESQGDVEAVLHAFEPLKELEGRVFACFGNHDHESPETIQEAFEALGIDLLVDAHTVVKTPVGEVEIIGSDFHWRERRERLAQLFEKVGPRNGRPRLLLLHDPGAFKHVPRGAVDLALSGHTHGGQIGTVSLGGTWTILAGRVPDHGFWGQGQSRLYVHRGTGHYGFPVRLGVPGEESVLAIRFSNKA